MFCEEEDGRVVSFPLSWTDYVAADPFVTVSAGRSAFRVADLLELADLLAGRSAGKPGGVQ